MLPVSSTIDARYNFALSQVFGATLLKRLDDEAYEGQIRGLLLDSGLYPPTESWDFVRGLCMTYDYLRTNYRCEYVYKNEIANQLLLRYHNDNSATLLREVASDRSIADVVIVNGKTVAYEIKTELDNLDRLMGQIESYQCIYDCLNIVTHPAAVEVIQKRVSNSVGIIVMSTDGCLETVREPTETSGKFDASKAILTLRQSELVSAYEKYVSKMPKMGSALIYTFCQDWYLKLELEDARIVFAESLKSRKPSTHQFNLILDCDNSLKMLFFGRDISKRSCESIRERLGISA